ncbi:MAG: hypothetical protein NTV52_12185 [Acidobacteria bacterium]|nr:hypothetical protein [Acidobacteriota bacterium]
MLPLTVQLKTFERIVITSRIKDCESAIDTLRRAQGESKVFDESRGGAYTLTDLRDLAGVRVLAFPRTRWLEANDLLRAAFPAWESRPMPDPVSGTTLVHKYNGYCSPTDQIRAELQISPMLIGQFLDIEHSAIYKPSVELEGAKPLMRVSTNTVFSALQAFDAELERLIQQRNST